MSGGILRFPWTSQPQTPVGVDWSNPLVAAIRPEFVFSASAPRVNVKNGKPVTVHSSVTYGVTGQGKAIVSDGVTGPQVQQSGGSTAARQSFTAVAVARIDSGGNYFTLVSDNVSGSAGWAIQNSNTGTQLTFIKSGVSELTTLNVPVGDPFVLVASHTTTGSGNYFLIIRNLRTGAITKVTGTQTSAATGSGDGIACINRSSTPNSYVGALNIAAFGYGGISESQGYALLSNPWQLFAPIQRTIWVPAAGGGGPTYTLTADSASYTLTGQTTGLAFNRVLTADTQSYALTGQAATLAFNRAMVAASAAYTLAGQDAGLSFNRVLAADTTAYTLTGQNVTLTYTPIGGPTYTLAADTASYALTGQDTGLLFNRVLTADTTAYALTGQAVGLSRGYTLTADTAAYSLTGSSASFVYNRVLAADGASYALTGQDVTLTYTPLSLPTIGRPASDTSNTGWLPSTGSDLYAMLDEVVPDDADYIYSTAVGQICEMPLDTTSYPGTASQTLKFRGSSSTGNSVIVRLKNTGGATVRTVTQALSATDTEYDITLTSGEIASITSGALSVELESA